MATYEYNCLVCSRSVDVHKPMANMDDPEHCEQCGKKLTRILRAPAGGAHFSRTWNEKANDARRDAYTQAKAQAEQVYNEQRDQGMHPVRTTEEGLQTAAREIDTDNRGLRPKQDAQAKRRKAARAGK